MSDTTLLDRLKNAREQAGLSISQAARLSNIDRVRLAGFEQNIAHPNQAELRVIAHVYGVDLRWLATGQLHSVILPEGMEEDAKELRALLGSLRQAEDGHSPVREARTPFVGHLLGTLDKQRLIIAYMIGNLPAHEQLEMAERFAFDITDYVATDMRAWWHYYPEEIMIDFMNGEIGEAFAAVYFAEDRLRFRLRFEQWKQEREASDE